MRSQLPITASVASASEAAIRRAEQLAAIAQRNPELAARLAALEAAASTSPQRSRSTYRSKRQCPGLLDDPATDPARWLGFC